MAFLYSSAYSLLSFCRKSTLNKHCERDHPGFHAPTQGDEHAKDDCSAPSPSEGPHYDGPWATSVETDHRQFSSQPGMTIKAEPQPDGPKSGPFKPMPTQGTPDPSYRNYPHPSLSMNQVQNLTGHDVQGYHPGMASQPWQPLSTAIIAPHTGSLQPSPSLLSSYGSSTLESPNSQDFAQSATSNKSMQFPSYTVESHQSLQAYMSPVHRNSCPNPFVSVGSQQGTSRRQAQHMSRHSLNDLSEASGFNYVSSPGLSLSNFAQQSSMAPAFGALAEQQKLDRLQQMQDEFQHQRPHTSQGSLPSSYDSLDMSHTRYQDVFNLGTVTDAPIAFLGNLDLGFDDKLMDNFGQPMPGELFGESFPKN